MATMTDEQRRRFLLEGTRTAILATVRANGRPHAAPVWFTLDGDDVLFTTAAATVKGRNLRRDGRATVVVDLQEPPYAYVMLSGTAMLSDDPGELRRVATAVGGRYMGANRAEEFGDRNAVAGELVVRLTPTTILSEGDVSG
ncbi:PPOX class F420-dependent oxidoreductase [soil metagenome]